MKFLHTLLFTLEPETAHHAALGGLNCAWRLGLLRFAGKPAANPCTVMGLNFPNPVGLAAGLDKNADYLDALAALGFGFVEIGTVTPRPQPGNPRPRLFRLMKEKAIINRMGFNSKGLEHVAKRLAHSRYRGILGVNLGKNKDTPVENAAGDYLLGFRRLWKFASYITINISSPNTPGLRDLQHADRLNQLLGALKQEQALIAQRENKYVPLVVKISPDLDDKELQELAQVLLQNKIDGVIATNTTTHREGVESSPFAGEAGGLSGRPLTARSTRIIGMLHGILRERIPIIASGGVMDESSAREKLKAGACLLQVYTGFIYSGPEIIKNLAVLK